jgi:hypothetical protein
MLLCSQMGNFLCNNHHLLLKSSVSSVSWNLVSRVSVTVSGVAADGATTLIIKGLVDIQQN